MRQLALPGLLLTGLLSTHLHAAETGPLPHTAAVPGGVATVELLLDGKLLVKEVAHPPGLYKDLGVDIYHNVKVPIGTHRLEVRMNDDVNVQGPTYTYEETIELEPGQLLIVNFDSDAGRFFIE